MTKIDLRNLTTQEFAEMIGEDYRVVREIIRDYSHLSYASNPYYNVVTAVQKTVIKESNKEIVAKFVYTSLFNRPEHRFYNGRGYGIELRATIS